MKQDIKKEAIILAAEKRFNHFTVSKTTMAEIAQDLGISKPLLYYYFPDKLSLYAAVVFHIFEEVRLQSIDILRFDDPLKNILLYLQSRKEFIIKHYNIIEFVKQALEKAPDELKPLFEQAKAYEINGVKAIFENGKKNNILYIKNLQSTTELFLSCLEGLRYITLQKDGVFVFPTKDQFDAISAREKEFASIFVKGLQIP